MSDKDEINSGHLFRLSLSFKRLKQIYEENLYPCKRCGTCCRYGEEIFVSKEEAKAIAKHLKTSFAAFKRRYKLIPNSMNGYFDIPGKPCPFLQGKNTCLVRPIRPHACRVFPFGRMYSRGKKLGYVELSPYCETEREMLIQENIIVMTNKLEGTSND